MFYSDKFTFDGISNDLMDVILVTTKNKDILSPQGIPYISSIEKSNTINDSPYYLETKRDTEEIELEFCYIDQSDYKAKAWDEDKLKEVISWLVQDEFKAFISEDNEEITYYLRATKVSKLLNKDMKGMIQITFRPYTAYGYKQRSKKVMVDTEKVIKIENESAITDNTYYPIFEVKGIDTSSTIEISNVNDESKVLIIDNLLQDEVITIDNLYYTVQDQTGKNCFDKVNRQWISLKGGNNQIKVKGKCEFTIKCNFPVLV